MRRICLKASDAGDLLFIEWYPYESSKSNSEETKESLESLKQDEVKSFFSRDVPASKDHSSKLPIKTKTFREEFDLNTQDETNHDDSYELRNILMYILVEKLEKRELRSSCYILIGSCKTGTLENIIDKRDKLKMAEGLCSYFERNGQIPRLVEHIIKAWNNYLEPQELRKLNTYLMKCHRKRDNFPHQYREDPQKAS